MFQKLKQFKDLRSKAKDLQSQLAKENVYAEHGGVSVVMDGNQEVMKVEIPADLLQPDKKDAVERGLKDAVNDATKKVQRLMVEKMRQSGNFNMPGLS